jgi:hypothetical protein
VRLRFSLGGNVNEQSNPSIQDNLVSLHEHEEALREQSLAVIASRAALADHLNLVREAMNVIYAFTQEHVHNSDDELTKQFLGIRLFNAAAVSIKLSYRGIIRRPLCTFAIFW